MASLLIISLGIGFVIINRTYTSGINEFENHNYEHSFELFESIKFYRESSDYLDASELQFAEAVKYDNDMEEILDEWHLPDLTNLNAVYIAHHLEQAGQAYEIIFRDDSTASCNSIIEQFPTAGSIINPDNVLTLYVNDYYGTNKANYYSNFKGIFIHTVERGQWLYYISDNKVIQTNKSFTEHNIVYESEEPSSLLIKGYYLYIVVRNAEENSLISVDLRTNKAERLITLNSIYQVVIMDNQIYISDNNREYSIYSLTSNQLKEETVHYSYLTYDDGVLYGYNVDDNGITVHNFHTRDMVYDSEDSEIDAEIIFYNADEIIYDTGNGDLLKRTDSETSKLYEFDDDYTTTGYVIGNDFTFIDTYGWPPCAKIVSDGKTQAYDRTADQPTTIPILAADNVYFPSFDVKKVFFDMRIREFDFTN